MRPRDEAGTAKVWLVLTALIAVALVSAGVVLWPRLTDDPVADPPEGPTTTGSPTTPEPTLQLAEPTTPDSVLEPASSSAASASKEIAALIRPLLATKRLGRHTVVQVSTSGADRPLWTASTSQDQRVAPASTLKLLTSLAALDQLGPDHRFETTVVAAGGSDRLVLVGGGDPLLTARTPRDKTPGSVEQATLAHLARQTGAALRESSVSRVRLGYDDSLFSGPAVNPAWEPSYISESIVSPISALWIDEGRRRPGLAQRVGDPSRYAAERFAALLDRQGIRVLGRPGITKAPSGGEQVAAVSSAPLEQIVQHVLEVSDNEGAEVLLRQAAIAAGQPGSFAGGTSTVRRTLASLHVPVEGARILDGSGLARGNRVSIFTLVETLQVASDPDQPQLRAVVTGLPVAGFTGSLEYRFTTAPAGLGQVRAKTGTLTGIHGLAGLVTTREGNVLTFAAVADAVPLRFTLAARSQLDRIAAALAGCRC